MPAGYSIYVDAPSALHQKVDPRTKLIALLATFVLALCFNHPLVLGLMMAGVLGLGLWARLPVRRLVPFLLAASWFILLAVLIWPVYIEQGPRLFTVFGVNVTRDGILFGLAMGLRVSLMLVAAGVWMMTTSPQKVTLGLLKMGLPYKAGLAMSSTIRFVPLVTAQHATITEAQRARGLRADRGHPLSRVVKSVAVLGPVFMRAIALAQSLAVAMDARGLGARDTRTSIVEIRLSRADWIIMALCGVAVVLGLVMRYLGIGVLVKGYL
jgi:energy-coupling factor transport system permease protein